MNNQENLQRELDELAKNDPAAAEAFLALYRKVKGESATRPEDMRAVPPEPENETVTAAEAEFRRLMEKLRSGKR